MAQKMSRGKRKTLGINIRPQEGLWIGYQIRRAGVDQRYIAAQAGVSPSLVTRVIQGKKNSERVKTALLSTLGFASWGQLIATARRAA